MSAVSGEGLADGGRDRHYAGDPGRPLEAVFHVTVWPHHGLPDTVLPGEGRNGMPERVSYDLSRPHLKAREQQVAALVAAAKAEAARRHARRGHGGGS